MNTIQPTSQIASLDAPPPTLSSALEVRKPVASAIHTAGMLVLLAGSAYYSVIRANHLRALVAPNHHLYLPTLAQEWIWFGYVVLGIRMRGVSLRELIGPRWSSAKQLFTDIGIAILFQICALIVLALVGHLLSTESNLQNIRFLAPIGPAEMVMWVLVAISAGICEETVFRGYLQRQFVGWTGNAIVGVLISAAVFGACHIYQSGKQAIVIGIYGALFGGLSLYRRSLKPGIIAHGLQDSASGILMSLLIKYKVGGM
jgi:membrane protease YdiL (CAAX protease family)